MIHLHMARVIHMHWTRDIEREWTRNVIGKGKADPGAVAQCLEGMRLAVPGWEVSGYERHIERFDAIHPKDRHVATAAFQLATGDWSGRTVGLITKNLRDFPARAFASTGVRRLAPGPYLDRLYDMAPKALQAVDETCRQKLRRPPVDPQSYVDILIHHQCSALARAMARVWSVRSP
ncbi:hypothetical protein [Roseateles terrae]|uniref:PIN domain-containing protein n=1 Tax=Roseateles terrae TaxID=431060 RepID=A0ABR6GU60_9BURK|nr:hypothetical protein [Roseateles terrae]MBB3194789.1 hypothetical protein [Roseateles terrae]